MRKFALSALTALALAGTAAHAGGIAEPVIEPEVVAQDAGSSSGGLIVPLLLLVLVVAAISGGNGRMD